METFIRFVHFDMLGRLYDLAQTDSKLSMILIPVMAHLRKIPIEISKGVQ